ncbi:hypothetical protein GQ53DRAFT_847658 [Thozetella sp. PMI_491]|nr:hypothetical protein GQ53DRAFT_847658 [Thozetella sp. PMI_491]
MVNHHYSEWPSNMAFAADDGNSDVKVATAVALEENKELDITNLQAFMGHDLAALTQIGAGNFDAASGYDCFNFDLPLSASDEIFLDLQILDSSCLEQIYEPRPGRALWQVDMSSSDNFTTLPIEALDEINDLAGLNERTFAAGSQHLVLGSSQRAVDSRLAYDSSPMSTISPHPSTQPSPSSLIAANVSPQQMPVLTPLPPLASPTVGAVSSSEMSALTYPARFRCPVPECRRENRTKKSLHRHILARVGSDPQHRTVAQSEGLGLAKKVCRFKCGYTSHREDNVKRHSKVCRKKEAKIN